MFDYMGDRISNAIKNIRGMGRITEDNITDAMREIRMALLEADVNYQVVKEFVNNVKEKALGMDVQKSLKPDELFIKIVKDELVSLLGGEAEELCVNGKPTIAMLVGLQGSGKTTTIGKLANFLRKKHAKKPLMVACDIYRPAAIEQLQTIGKELNIPVYTEGKIDVNTIVKHALEYAKENGNDYVLIDTAGRLHIDEALMDELEGIVELCHPQEVLLVIDAMMGQDAINVITGFNDKLNLTGCILTKLDGDTKGGVALSVRYLTNVPIKFVGDSEKMDGLSAFYPERMAERILDMGDVLSIAEKVEGVISEEDAEAQAKRMMSGKYDLEDFLKSMKQIKKLGPLENLLKLLPQARKMGISDVQIDPKDMAHIEAIILSMTPYERKHPECLKASRKQRISKGCGRDVAEINRLLKQFEEMKKMMKMFSNGNMKFPGMPGMK
jgi:signal recognition particle subunit SRP54